MDDKLQYSTDTLLPGREADIEGQLHFSLNNAAAWGRAEDSIQLGHMKEEDGWPAYLSMPSNGPLPAPAGLDAGREVLHPEALAPPHKRSAISGLDTDDRTDTRSENATNCRIAPDINGELQEDTPLPSTEQANVELRDAKQVLAERAAERERRKRERATQVLPPRKRARKALKASSSVDLDSVEQHHMPTEILSTNSLAAPWPALSPSHATNTSEPLLSLDELRVISNLMAAQSMSVDLTTTYTSARLNSMTESIWTALCKDALSEFSLKVHGAQLWTHIGEEVIAWPEEWLRVLASMEVLPTWWWVREGLVDLVVLEGAKVDDGEMDMVWNEHAERVAQRKGSAERG
ncbi:uncharacterized protein CC84DRAFT_1201147 [Paraphaeosphaeria sporulosa]|uniref:Uncharacterized protein n=1 Tax=Paraphaeosphaeria sporulosa TaxID=1460663 RepID=A0A177CXW2_9PLEO|nr:uncharacterized protein CC84DRAFT_1201147 [Paraphaeosphaeria sporulosa]OAG12041.1 hypothetical protein CC84DRAFT_1201147 [Paraphaeosphaeria sporulosa]